jgi:hypothetical protein
VVKPVQPVLTPPAMEETVPSTPAEVSPPLSFSQSDAQLIRLVNASNFQVDIPALLMSELDWNLTEEQPSVLILHSHGSESYTKTEQNSYQSSGAYRTLDTQHNMVVTLTVDAPDAKIHYTLDGSQPTKESPIYDKPFSINRSQIVTALAIRDGRQIGNIKTKHF